MIKKYYFWNNFSRYLTIGLSALILLVASQQMVLGDVFQRGPDPVLAEEDNCLNPEEFGCPEPGFPGDEIPIPPPEVPPPPETPPAPEVPPPAAACPFEFKYNECIACNTSQPVEQDCNGTYKVGPAQTDSACANWCEAAPPPPPPAPAPQPPAPPAPRPPAPPAPAPFVPAPITNINQNQNSNTTNVTTNVSNNTSVSNSSSSVASVSVPSGGQQIVREVVREVPVVRQAVVSGNVGVGTTAGQVLAVKELPKTGLPALAWAALAFIPAGFRIKRFSKVKQELIDNPNYLWEDRQFKVGS